MKYKKHGLEEAYKKFITKYNVRITSKNIRDSYKSWIPTDTGRFYFKYIANELGVDIDTKKIIKDSKNKKIILFDFKPEISDQISFGILKIFQKFPDQDPPILFLELATENNVYHGSVSISFFNKISFNKIKKKITREHYKYLDEIREKMDNENNTSKCMLNYSNTLKEIYKKHSISAEKKVLEHLKEDLSSFKCSCNFIISKDGKVFLSGINKICIHSDIKEENTIDRTDLDIYNRLETTLYYLEDSPLYNDHDTLALILYTGIKRTMHSDKHHDAKLDTFIGIYKKHEFSPDKLLLKMQLKVKEIEFVLKREQREPTQKYSQNAKGIFAYMNSLFLIYYGGNSTDNLYYRYRCMKKHLLRQKQKSLEILKFTENTIESISSISEKVLKYQPCPDYAKGVALISITFFLSIFGLLLAYIKVFGKSESWLAGCVIASALIICTYDYFLISKHKPCFFKNALYKKIGRERYLVFEHRFPHIKKWVSFIMGIFLASSFALVAHYIGSQTTPPPQKYFKIIINIF